ncbi:hypothetical protein ElyMa_003061100, partial [Elysia marginata]
QTVALLRYTHFLWRSKLTTVLIMADRFEKRALEQQKTRSDLPLPAPTLHCLPPAAVVSTGDFQLSSSRQFLALGEDVTFKKANISFNLENALPPKEQAIQPSTIRSKTLILPSLRRN